jgi:hypothetical protein
LFVASLLARVDSIGHLNRFTGQIELRIYIDSLKQSVMRRWIVVQCSFRLFIFVLILLFKMSYFVFEHIPLFIYQYSSWSSVSPASTHRFYGLLCRKLTCGDQIIVLADQRTRSSKRTRPLDYTQQSLTKCLVERYRNDKSFVLSAIEHGHKRMKMADDRTMTD